MLSDALGDSCSVCVPAPDANICWVSGYKAPKAGTETLAQAACTCCFVQSGLHTKLPSQACRPARRHHARRCACNTLLDPFAGVGGNVIQMAATCERVIAGELSPERTSLTRHNADVYGVAERIEARCCDFWDSSSPAEVGPLHSPGR